MVSRIHHSHWGTENTLSVSPADVQRKPGQTRTRKRHALRVSLSLETVEAAVLVLVVALGIVYAGTALGQMFVRPKHPPVIQVKVQPGDTLWTLANRYGYPEDYILKRVDHLAAYNHILASAHLQPGSVLNIPVENPSEQARLTASK